jgi:hypothetical protein
MIFSLVVQICELDELETCFDAVAWIEEVAQGIADKVEALCGRERSASPQPKSRATRGI